MCSQLMLQKDANQWNDDIAFHFVTFSSRRGLLKLLVKQMVAFQVE